MVTVRELLGEQSKDVEESLSLQREKKRNSFSEFVDRAIIVLGTNCPHCRELVQSSAFKELLKAAEDRIILAFEDEGYLYGADYSNLVNLLERRVGIATPSLVYREGADTLTERDELSLLKLARILGIPLVPKRRSRKSSEESSRSRKSKKRSSKTNEFVERKQRRKEVRRALQGCVGEVCIEV